jgi:hypothetical protein
MDRTRLLSAAPRIRDESGSDDSHFFPVSLNGFRRHAGRGKDLLCCGAKL